MVGAPGASGRGAAYVFARSGATWTPPQKLTAPHGAAQDQFGASVAIDADTVMVGAYGADGVNVNQGAAYVFTS